MAKKKTYNDDPIDVEILCKQCNWTVAVLVDGTWCEGQNGSPIHVDVSRSSWGRKVEWPELPPLRCEDRHVGRTREVIERPDGGPPRFVKAVRQGCGELVIDDLDDARRRIGLAVGSALDHPTTIRAAPPKR